MMKYEHVLEITKVLENTGIGAIRLTDCTFPILEKGMIMFLAYTQDDCKRVTLENGYASYKETEKEILGGL